MMKNIKIKTKKIKIPLFIINILSICCLMSLFCSCISINNSGSSSTKIAETCIQRAKEKAYDTKPPYDSRFVQFLGSTLWIYEFNSRNNYTLQEEKEIVEEIARLILTDKDINPKPVDYGWRTNYLDNKVYTYNMIIIYNDNTYVVLYSIDKDKWQSAGLTDPPGVEQNLKLRMG